MSVVSLAVGLLAPAGASAGTDAHVYSPADFVDRTPDVRGDIPGQVRGISVTQVTESRNDKHVKATVRWNQALLNRKSGRDRFNVRLVAFPTDANDPVVLINRSKTRTPPPVQTVHIRLGTGEAQTLRSAERAVLTVSQQHGSRTTRRYSRAYVTATDLSTKARSGLGPKAADSRTGRDCMPRLLRPGANLAGCDLTGASLRNCVITRANLTAASLRATLLRGCVVKKTKLADADLTGVTSGGLVGTPASLPAGWTLTDGFLVQSTPSPPLPPVPPSCASMDGAAGTCVVGDAGPGGGTVFYADEMQPAGSRYLEAAPNSWDGIPSAADPALKWAVGNAPGECGNIDLATGTAIGTGASNTELITQTSACDSTQTAPAAWAARNYTSSTGVSDWFLPSKDELNQLCKWASGQTTSVADQSVPCNSSGVLRVGFTSFYYWSSSQNGAYFARSQYLGNGVTSSGDKDGYSLFVRPIRAF